jgi:hypothetical protein
MLFLFVESVLTICYGKYPVRIGCGETSIVSVRNRMNKDLGNGMEIRHRFPLDAATCYTCRGATNMALTISLPDEAETRLRERARAAGQDVTQYLQQLITRELVAPLSLAEAAEPLARAVDAAGVTDDEFTSILVEARDAVRRDRRKPA